MKTGIFKTDITDHYSIFCITDLYNIYTNKSNILTKRAFSNKNISKFKKCLNNFSWTDILGGNFETTYTSFHMQFRQIFKTSFPKKLLKFVVKIDYHILPRHYENQLKKTHTEICIPEESYSGK